MNLDLLSKVWQLTKSSNAGEAAAARERARVMVERHGKTLADIPALLGKSNTKPAPPPPGPSGFQFYDINNPDHMSAWAENDRRRRAERSAKEAPARAEVIARYGSEAAVLAWTREEELLRHAVKQWSTFGTGKHSRWVSEVAGCGQYSGKLPAEVQAAIEGAYPIPTTVTAAKAEYNMWEARDHDLGLVLENTSDTQLDLPAFFRREIVCELLETGLRSASIAEIIIRQRHSLDTGHSQPEIDKAVLLDLEALAQTSVQDGQADESASSPATNTSKRRAEVMSLLSNVDTALLSDREISRRAGVSPQTVGNLRRKLSKAAACRTQRPGRKPGQRTGFGFAQNPGEGDMQSRTGMHATNRL